ncbi:unnamed protein product [Sphagnum tenellum]
MLQLTTLLKVLDTTNGPVYLYSAFIDDRQLSEEKQLGPTVRVFALLKSPLKLHCQIWYESRKEPLILPASIMFMSWRSDWWETYGNDVLEHMITCEVPYAERFEKPVLISMVNEPCEYAKNALKLSYYKRAKWEKRVIIYYLKIHENTERMLKHYAMKGFVDLIPITMPGYYTNHHALQWLLFKYRYIYHVALESVINYPGHHAKCLFSTKLITVLFNHGPLRCLTYPCDKYVLPNEDAQLSHYRSDCTYNVGKSACDDYHANLVNDTQVVWRYRGRLVKRAKEVLDSIRVERVN